MVLMIALIISSITLYVVAKNLDSSTVVEYEWNGVVVTFDEGNNSILNGVPITTEYASKLFDNTLLNDPYKGVVIKVKESKFDSGTIIFYSDKTALIKYDNRSYVKVKALDNNYGVEEDGTIKSGAITNSVSVEENNNDNLGI